MADSETRTVALPAVFDLDALDAVRDELVEAIDAGPTVVSGGAVERVSTNAVLLLLSAAETARRNDYEFTIASVSAALGSAVERLGLEPYFAPMTKGLR